MVAKKKTTRRRVKKATRTRQQTRQRCYRTSFQGDRPFRVCVKNGIAHVTGRDVMANLEMQKMWLGDNGEHCNDSGTYAEKGKFPANTILIKHRDGYALVGNVVRSFALKDDEIVSFYSPMGNGIVPYPYAIGKKYTYLFAELIRGEKFGYMRNEDLAERKRGQSPYMVFWDDAFKKKRLYKASTVHGKS